MSIKCAGSSAPIRSSGKVPAQAGLPDTTPHFGVHATYGDWQTMYHALFNLVYDHQGGPRGGDKTFVSGMFMGMAAAAARRRDVGFAGDAFARPFMGPNGYRCCWRQVRRQMAEPI